MNNIKKVIREITSRKDPSGYYVVLAINNDYVKTLVNKYIGKGLVVDAIGDVLVIRCKSRRVVEEIARILITKKFLVLSNP